MYQERRRRARDRRALPVTICIVLTSLALRLIVADLAAQESAPAVRRAAIPIEKVDRDEAVDFEKEILPILRKNCLACHNQTKAKADLVLETPQTILKGSENGPVVLPGHSQESLLLRVAAHQLDPAMPPRDNKVAASDLTSGELGLLSLWIDQGAHGGVLQAAAIPWQPLPENLRPIYAVAVSPDGQLAACNRGNRIQVYQLASGKLLANLVDQRLLGSRSSGTNAMAHQDMVRSLAFSPDGNFLASGAYREIKLWRRPRNVQQFHLAAADQPVSATAVSKDGRWLAIGLRDGGLRLANLPGGESVLEQVDPRSRRREEVEHLDLSRPTSHPPEFGGDKGLPRSEITRALTGHTDTVHGLSFSPDGKWLASSSEDKSVRVWEVATGKAIISQSVLAPVTALTWLPDGQQVAGGTLDGMVRVWQVTCQPEPHLAQVREWPGSGAPVRALVAVPLHPELLWAADESGLVTLWDSDIGEAIREFDQGGALNSVALSSDGQRLATVGADDKAKLWRLDDGKELAALHGDPDALERVAEAERGWRLATNEVAFSKTSLERAEKERKSQLDRVRKASDALAAAEKSEADKRKAMGEAVAGRDSAEKRITQLNDDLAKAKAADASAQADAAHASAALQTLLCEISSHPGSGSAGSTLAGGPPPTAAALAATQLVDDLSAKARAAGEAKVLVERATAESQAQRKEAEDKLAAARKLVETAEAELKKAERGRSIAESELSLGIAAAQRAADGSTDAQTAITAAETELQRGRTELDHLKGLAARSEQPIWAVGLSPDNQLLASVGDDQAVHTWSADTGQPCDSFRGQGHPLAAVAFAGCNIIISVGDDGSVVGWNASPEWPLERVLGTGDSSSAISDRANALAFSPDGRTLAVGSGEPSRSGEIQLWDVASGRIVQEFTKVHSDAVLALEFSPSGKQLASSGADRFMKVVDLSSGKVVRSFEGHTHHVLGLAWKRDGRTLATSGADNVVKIWDFQTGQRLKNVEGYAKEVTSISCFAADQFLTTSGDHQVRLVSEKGEEIRAFAGESDFIYSGAVTPDGTRVLAGGEQGILRVWNGRTGQLVATWE